MKYLFLSIFVLCLGLVGCSKDRGPDTGWECPMCGWGCAETATKCMNDSESCTGYKCFSCGERSLKVNNFTQTPEEKAIGKIADGTRRLQSQICDACGASLSLIGWDVSVTETGTWVFPSGWISEEWMPVKR